MVPDLVKMTWPEYGTLWKSPSELISSSVMRHSPTRLPRPPRASLCWANGRVARNRASVRARIAPSERNESFVVMVVGPFIVRRGVPRGRARRHARAASGRRVRRVPASSPRASPSKLVMPSMNCPLEETPTGGPAGGRLYRRRGSPSLLVQRGSRQQRLRRPAPAARAGLRGSCTGRRLRLSGAVEAWAGRAIAVLRNAIAEGGPLAVLRELGIGPIASGESR